MITNAGMGPKNTAIDSSMVVSIEPQASGESITIGESIP